MKLNPQIKEDLKKRLAQQTDIDKQKLVIISSHMLDGREIEKILAPFPDLIKLPHETIVDPEILGGFILRFGSKEIDLSIRHILQTFVKKTHETH
jgi:F0F1-type ATP synthase delta subunit